MGCRAWRKRVGACCRLTRFGDQEPDGTGRAARRLSTALAGRARRRVARYTDT